MFYNLVEKLDKVLGFEQPKAHCEVPCGIFDPITAQIAEASKHISGTDKKKNDPTELSVGESAIKIGKKPKKPTIKASHFFLVIVSENIK